MSQSWPFSTTHLHKFLSAAQTAVIALIGGSILYFLYNVLYRVFFHPLARYPGPLLGKITNLYGTYHAWKGDIHLDVLRCHQLYGDRVRYAPNRVLINTTEGLRGKKFSALVFESLSGACDEQIMSRLHLTDIYSYKAHVRKFDGYKVLSSQAENILTMSNKAQHARRRRVISQAFSESSLRLFEPTIISMIDRFCKAIRGPDSFEGKSTPPRDMARYFTYLTFDMITNLFFDSDFNTMEDPEFRYVVPAIEESNIRLSVLWQAPKLTLGGLDRKILPESVRAARKYVDFLRLILKNRLQQQEGGSKDIFSFLQQFKDPDTGERLSIKELSTETATFLVAGTDSSSTTMAGLGHYLVGSPRSYQRAAEEVRTTFASAEEIRLGVKINSCVFLRACLDESLRLSPPGGGPLWRVVEEEGAVIDGEFIPGGCEVGAGIYAMHQSPGNWADPTSYKPERWLDKTGAQQPYFPFNIGPRSCVGKPLAVAQIMLTFARLLWEFDFGVQDGDNALAETSDMKTTQYVLKDHITGHKEGPVLHFRPRF